MSHIPTIRPATSTDAAPLAMLARRVFAATYGAIIPPPTLHAYLGERFTAAAFAAQIVATPAALFVADVHGVIAGYARLDTVAPPECVGNPQAVELAQLYIDALYQGSGIGTALLTAATTTSACLWLCAWERNTRALRFYTRHGFAPVGGIDIYVHDVRFRDFVMVRKIGQIED